MARITTNERRVDMKFALQRGDETTSRTIQVPATTNTETLTDEALLTAAETWGTTYMASYANGQEGAGAYYGRGTGSLIQPANWRDNDDHEEAWICTAVTPEVVTISTLREQEVE